MKAIWTMFDDDSEWVFAGTEKEQWNRKIGPNELWVLNNHNGTKTGALVCFRSREDFSISEAAIKYVKRLLDNDYYCQVHVVLGKREGNPKLRDKKNRKVISQTTLRDLLPDLVPEKLNKSTDPERMSDYWYSDSEFEILEALGKEYEPLP